MLFWITTIPGGWPGGRPSYMKIWLTQPNFVEFGLRLSLAILRKENRFFLSPGYPWVKFFLFKEQTKITTNVPISGVETFWKWFDTPPPHPKIYLGLF